MNKEEKYDLEKMSIADKIVILGYLWKLPFKSVSHSVKIARLSLTIKEDLEWDLDQLIEQIKL